MTSTQVDFPAAKRIAVWSGFQRGRQYQHLRFIVIDVLSATDANIIQTLQEEGKAYHYFITEDGQIFQQVLEEDTALTNALGERPEQFWFFAAQHGQVDVLSIHIALIVGTHITREMLTTLAGVLEDLNRRHRLMLVPASNNGGVALRSSLDFSRDMHGFTAEMLKDVLLVANHGMHKALESYPSVNDQAKSDEPKAEDEEKDEEKPKRGRPRKDESKDESKDEKGSNA